LGNILSKTPRGALKQLLCRGPSKVRHLKEFFALFFSHLALDTFLSLSVAESYKDTSRKSGTPGGKTIVPNKNTEKKETYFTFLSATAFCAGS